jgi:hypothetical protein
MLPKKSKPKLAADDSQVETQFETQFETQDETQRSLEDVPMADSPRDEAQPFDEVSINNIISKLLS